MKYGLVLAGGGVRGAFQIGVWKALREMNIEISAVSGASIGAINGALIAQGEYENALKLWRKISAEDIIALPEGMNGEYNIFKIRNMPEIAKEIYIKDGLDMSPLQEILERLIDEDKLRNSPIDFGVAAFSVTKKKEIYKFKNEIPKGLIVEYLMASACMLGVRNIDEDKLIDGGVSNNMPVNMLLERGINNIITVDVKGVGIYRSFNFAGKNIISIRSKAPQTGIMDFDRDGIIRSIDEGYMAAMKAFGRFSGELYSFRSDDYMSAREKYSQELISGLEQAAKAFGINNLEVYTFEGLKTIVMEKYNMQLQRADFDLRDNLIEKIRRTDSSLAVIWIVKLLESGKSDFAAEKLSKIGANYDAASAIMYFKQEK